ncbi:hypothetical protein [Desulfonatronovibrio magnus]|uniref:hypothetical protein n=1 Tax=Desulfonatronovibrio magnus TaxID=698827 RepID=UPI000A01BBC9|nr:hypothetical protein [Desulfonatronovibrio magnus]
MKRKPSPEIHPWLSEQEVKVIRGEAVARAGMQLRSQGFFPDVICVHPGWGEGLFLRDVWPDSKIICFCEFYYQARGSDVGFDPEFSSGRQDEDLFRLRMKNAHNFEEGRVPARPLRNKNEEKKMPSRGLAFPREAGAGDLSLGRAEPQLGLEERRVKR